MIEWVRNSKKLILSIAGTLGVKGLSLLISLVTTAAYMNYFSDSMILGVWLAIVSILNWIINFDLGIGNGLRNKLVEALNSNENTSVRRCVSSAYLLLGGISVIILVIGHIALGLINWNKVLNIPDNLLSSTVLLTVIRITFSGIIVQFFLRLIISILYAIQKPAVANLIALISHSLILIFVCIFRIENVEKSMLILAIVNAVMVNIPLLLTTIFIWKKDIYCLCPKFEYYDNKIAKGILNLSYQFFWIQLSLLVVNSTNDFLITHFWGPDYVVEYQIYDKFFILFSSGFSLITVPIWSAVTKAQVENKLEWIKKTYRVLLLIAMGIGTMVLVLPFIYQNIVDIWLRNKSIEIYFAKALTFAIYNIFLIFNYASTSIANGLGKLKLQMRSNTIAAIAKIPLVLIFAKYVDSWICVIHVNILIMLPCVILQPVLNIKYLNKNLNSSDVLEKRE